jgi:hypothetical protein
MDAGRSWETPAGGRSAEEDRRVLEFPGTGAGHLIFGSKFTVSIREQTALHTEGVFRIVCNLI